MRGEESGEKQTETGKLPLIRAAAGGALTGLVAALSMTLVMLVLRWLAGVPTPSEMVGDRLAPTFSAGEFLGLLQRFGGYNQLKQLGVSSVLLGQLAAGILGGIAFAVIAELQQRRSPERRRSNTSPQAVSFAVCFVVLFWIGSLASLWSVLSTSFLGLRQSYASFATAAGLLLAYATYGWILIVASQRITARRSAGQAGAGAGRRVFVAGAAAAALTTGLLYRLYCLATFSYDGTQYIGAEVEPITPNDRFYTVTKNIVDPQVSKTVWRLEIAGMVEQPHVYTFEDLKSLSTVNQETTLMCISNWVGGGLMSNAMWRGVPLRSLIEAAGPKPGSAKVLFRAVDGYTDTIALGKAMDPTTLVAFEMNGAPLPERHGFPVRVVVPGMFGEKNVKWVTRIVLVGEDAKGFYETQGWGPSFVVPTRARFDFPYYDQTIPMASSILLKGIAFGGDRGVSKVEVSTDGGSTWQETKVDYAGTRLGWTLWSYDWRPAHSGDHKLVVRAVDSSGEVQTQEERGTVPEGATGYHRVTLRLSEV